MLAIPNEDSLFLPPFLPHFLHSSSFAPSYLFSFPLSLSFSLPSFLALSLCYFLPLFLPSFLLYSPIPLPSFPGFLPPLFSYFFSPSFSSFFSSSPTFLPSLSLLSSFSPLPPSVPFFFKYLYIYSYVSGVIVGSRDSVLNNQTMPLSPCNLHSTSKRVIPKYIISESGAYYEDQAGEGDRTGTLNLGFMLESPKGFKHPHVYYHPQSF